jgi:hypothetical protein
MPMEPSTPTPSAEFAQAEVKPTPRFNPEVHGTDSALDLEKVDDESLLEIIVSRSPSKPPRTEQSLAKTMPDDSGISDQTLGQHSMTTQSDSLLVDETTASEERETQAESVKSDANLEPKQLEPACDLNIDDAGNSSSKAVEVEAKINKQKSTQKSTLIKSNVRQPSIKQVTTVLKSKPATSISTSKKPIVPNRVTAKPAAPKALSVAKRTASDKAEPKAAAESLKRQSTKPNFELPGEAIARKLKEQRRERLQREEERQKTLTSVKPSLGFRSVRGTASTQPRPSIATQISKSSVAQSTRTVPRSVSVNTIQPAKVVVPKPISKPTTKHLVEKKTVPVVARREAVVSAHQGSVVKPNIGRSDLDLQKIRAKEIYERGSKSREELEKQKADKEQLAKKARLEAAERSRKASRLWAEKQKLKAKPVLAQ